MLEFRDYLSSELARRQALNPRYSLRAFAKRLGTDPSTLSRILRDKIPLTPKTIKKMGESIGLSNEELTVWIQPKKYSASRSDREIRADHYRLIADWYHYAIFELFAVTDFTPSIAEISSRLGISPAQSRDGLMRLIRLGVVEKRNKTYQRTTNYITTQNTPFSTPALRVSQHQALAMADEALELTPYEDREQIGLTIAARASDLPEVKKRIRKFHKQMNDWLEKRGQADTVYVMTTAFHPVSKKIKKERSK